MKSDKMIFFKLKILIMILSLCYFAQSQSKPPFSEILPSQSQIFTLPVIINQSVIQIFSHSKKQTLIDNQLFPQLNQMIGFNLTYSKSTGFLSEWTKLRLDQYKYSNLTGMPNQIEQQKKNSKLKCFLTNPQIIFRNISSFALSLQHQIHAPKIITNYEQLLNQKDIVLDLWKQKQQNNFKKQLILMIMSDGNLVVVKRDHFNEQYKITKIKVFKELRDAQFNVQRYQKQKKIYIFSAQVQIQLTFPGKNSSDEQEQIDLNFLKIQRQNSSLPLIQFQWFLFENEYRLALIIQNQMQFFEFNYETKSYQIIQNSSIGILEIGNFNNIKQNQFKQEFSQIRVKYASFYYDEQQNMIIALEKKFGLILCAQKPDGSFKIVQMNNISEQKCEQLALTSSKRYQFLNYRQLFLNCKNILGKRKYYRDIANISVNKEVYFQTTIPSGEIILAPSDQGNLIFVKGQTGIVAFTSWIYPKLLDQQNLKVDNFFSFGKQYAMIFQNQVILGEFQINHQKVLCSYSKQSQNNTSQANQSPIGPLQLYIEYLSQCTSLRLQKAPYQLKNQQYKDKQFCRYKKRYANIYLANQPNSPQIASTSSEVSLEILLSLIAVILILLIGLGIWFWQKKRIRQILESEGMPVGSQEFDTEEAV